jgi:hypothetical protein
MAAIAMLELVESARAHERYRAIDLNTYDTSDGLGSCVGYGATEQEARRNLLDAIAECDAEPNKLARAGWHVEVAR